MLLSYIHRGYSSCNGRFFHEMYRSKQTKIGRNHSGVICVTSLSDMIRLHLNGESTHRPRGWSIVTGWRHVTIEAASRRLRPCHSSYLLNVRYYVSTKNGGPIRLYQSYWCVVRTVHPVWKHNCPNGNVHSEGGQLVATASLTNTPWVIS